MMGVLIGLVACAPPDTFVGPVDDSDARVGLVTRGEAAALFLCGGADSVDVFHHWFDLRRDGEGWVGASRQDALEATLQPQPGGPGFEGRVVDGEATLRASFSLEPGGPDDGPWTPESPPSESLGSDCTAGAVVFSGGGALQGVVTCVSEPLAAQVVPVGSNGLRDAIRSGRVEVQVRGAPDASFPVVPALP